ncbi:hypothetical protein COLO4_21522 [Corchorus olitorius]|uniref:Uncharacterized protein n=1 Tax=Corchorus olitorius TaxID=93759 RepID=A0A1R3ISU7_9ROSI|nr:hypothetical protein COLO4_21522 [Corchorus olitorius]
MDKAMQTIPMNSSYSSVIREEAAIQLADKAA